MSTADSIYNQIINHFPDGMTPRPVQEKILKEIAGGIRDGFHYILLDAGTGIGKSAIAVTLARYFETAYIVTVTKQLQDQYYDDFKYPVIKGRKNFSCLDARAFNKEVTCEDGICQKGNVECDYGISPEGSSICFVDVFNVNWYFKGENHCNYWEQKGRAVQSPITLMNYANFFIEMNFLTHFGKRKLGVFDEAHNIEDQMMDRISHTLANEKLKKHFKDYINILAEFGELRAVPQISDDAYMEDIDFWKIYLPKFVDNYLELVKLKDLTLKKRKKYARIIHKLRFIIKEFNEHPEDWIIDARKEEEQVIFKPIEVSRFVKDYFLKYTDYKLLMSATILNKEHFCRWHGIDPEDVLYIQEKSPFEIYRRPIYLKTAGSMSYKSKEKTMPRTIPVLKKILAYHSDDKGLIHTNSHELANYIYKELNDPRLIKYSPEGTVKSGPSREEIIDKYKNSPKPLVLVAPSVQEGVDFPDELNRFQIIYKIPFPYLGDKQVAVRNERDQHWYGYKTVISLVQAYGRGMRNKEDYCDTFITDTDIYAVMNEEWRKCIYFIPEYFREAIV